MLTPTTATLPQPPGKTAHTGSENTPRPGQNAARGRAAAVRLCVCVCVCERERERDRQTLELKPRLHYSPVTLTVTPHSTTGVALLRAVCILKILGMQAQVGKSKRSKQRLASWLGVI